MTLDASPLALPVGVVLKLSAARADWCSIELGGAATAGTAPVSERTPSALAAAALAARDSVRGAGGACTLSLGGGLARVRLMRLPTLKRAELQDVLQRKAAALIEAPVNDVVWQARATRGADGEAGESTWLLAAARASELRGMRAELRRHGFRVKRIVPAHLAALDFAHSTLARSDQAAISVHFLPSSISIALIANGELVHLDELDGDFLGAPLLAASLLQTVKTTAGYWRKLSRGSALEQVVVVGLPSERGALLGHALEASLPGAVIRVLPGDGAAASAGREFAIGSALVPGPFALSLAARAPLHRLWTSLGVGASVLAVAAFGVVQRDARVASLDELHAQTERMRVRAATLERLAQQHDAAVARTDQLEQKFARLFDVGDQGLRHDEWLERVLRALQGRAELFKLDLRPAAADATLLKLEAGASAEPAAFALALHEIERALADEPDFGALAFELPTEITDAEQSALLRFGLEAHLRHAR